MYVLFRESLVPLHVDGDGHCLVHAVSRALVGRELFWHPLRVGLKHHFITNIDKYKVIYLYSHFVNCFIPCVWCECSNMYWLQIHECSLLTGFSCLAAILFVPPIHYNM